MLIKKLIFCLIFLFVKQLLAYEYQIIHKPKMEAYKNSMQNYILLIPAASSVKSATLYYRFEKDRKLTGTVFQSKRLIQKDNRFSNDIHIPGNLTDHYLFYYFQVQFDSVKQNYPEMKEAEKIEYLSIKLSVDTNQPSIILLEPKENSEVSSNKIKIWYTVSDRETSIDKNTLKLIVNGQDLTGNVSFQGNNIILELPEDTPAGLIRHSLSVKDKAGNLSNSSEFKFTVRKIKKITQDTQNSEQNWKGNGNISYNFTSAISNVQSTKSFSTQTLGKNRNQNISAQYSASNEETTINIGPILMTDADSVPGARGNRFSFGVKHKEYDLRWGDISSDISRQTLSTSLLGGFIGYKEEGNKAGAVEFKIAYGQTREGFSAPGTGQAGAFSRNSAGAFLGYNALRGLQLFSAYQRTDDLIDIINKNAGIPGFKNQSTEHGFTFNIPKYSLNIVSTYAISLNEGIANNDIVQQGYSFSTQINYQLSAVQLNLGLTYSETSLDFVVLSGGGGASDQRNFGVTLSKVFWEGLLSWNSSNTFSHNNLARLRPQTTYNYNSSNSFALTFNNWPSLNLTNGVLYRESTIVDNNQTRNISINNNAGTSHSFEYLIKQSINGNFSYVLNRDASTPAVGGDSNSMGVNTSHISTFSNDFNMTLNFSFNESTTLPSNDKNQNYTYGAAFNYNFLNGNLVESLSINKNQGVSITDGVRSLQSTSYNFALNSNLSLREALKFSLNLNYGTSQFGRDVLTAFPGNFTMSFQFSMQL